MKECLKNTNNETREQNRAND